VAQRGLGRFDRPLVLAGSRRRRALDETGPYGGHRQLPASVLEPHAVFGRQERLIENPGGRRRQARCLARVPRV